MKRFTFLTLLMLTVWFSPAKAETGSLMTNDVFFFITEGGPLASIGTTVELFNSDTSFSFVTSDPFGGEVIAGVPFGTYTYSIMKDCFEVISDDIEVDANEGMGISVFADLQQLNVNNVFFFITEGGPLASIGASVELSNDDTTFMFVTSDPFGGEMIAEVPYGDYTLSVTKDCFESFIGDVSVGCNDGMGVSVFVDLAPFSTNNVFFFITEGGPLASIGANVEFSNDDTTYTYVTSDPFGGEMIADVPYGEYNLTITKTCFDTFEMGVTVDCAEGMNLSVFADLQEDAQATNNVFFFITEGGPLASLGAEVTLTGADTSYTFVTSDPFGGEMVADVQVGTYTYTVTKECFLTATGTVEVICDPSMGISVFIDLEEGAPNDIFFFITEGGPLASIGATVNLFNDDTSFSFVTSDPFGGEMLANVPGGTFQYAISKPCFETAAGSVLIGCNEDMAISLFVDLVARTSNDVFFFITEGGPLASIGTSVSLSNNDTSFSFVTSDPFGGEMIAGVPYGEYTYEINKDCFVGATGMLTVDCNEGMNISVFADIQEDTNATNNVFFFITEGGPLASLGAEVTFTGEDTSYNFVTSDPFGGEMIADVRVGTYTYTVTKECFLTASGTVEVICDPNMGISVFIDLEEGAPNDIFFFITEGGPLASLGATVNLFNDDTSFSFVTSDPFGGEMLANVPGGTFQYAISKPCFETAAGSVLIGCNEDMAISLFVDLVERTSNDVFFFITEGGPLASIGTSVSLSNSDTSFSFVTSDPFGGEMIAGVPYGEYTYEINKDCFVGATGMLTVDCNGGMNISVFADIQADTNATNNVFFFITEGGPLASLGAEVMVTGEDTSYNFVTSDPFGGEMIADVRVGTYTYTVTKECFLTATGTVEVICDPNMGISVFIDLEEGATNDIFFFITEGGPLASIGATVNLFNDDTSFSFVTSDPFGGEMLANVPGGTFQYAISKPCFETATGSVLIGCNEDMAISLFVDLVERTSNDVFFFITEGGPLASIGTTVSFSNNDTSYSFVTSDPFGGEMISGVPYGDYTLVVTKPCYEADTSVVTVNCNDGMGVSVFVDLQTVDIPMSISERICDGETYAFGSQELTVSGEYTETFTSSNGCDSTVVLTLTVDVVDVSVTQNDNVLTANAVDATYQWVDCDDDFNVIEGAVEQTFSAETSGNYAVVVSQNGCVDTSDCINVVISGLSFAPWPDEVSIYPNPVGDILNVSAGSAVSEFNVRVVSTLGIVVYERRISGQLQFNVPVGALADGTYILQLISGNTSESIQFVKVH